MIQGTLISTPLITVPALLSLPNAPTASRAHDITFHRLIRLTTTLSTLAVTAYITSLLFASKRHPYLIYSAFLSAAAGGWVLNRQGFSLWGRTQVEDGFEVLEEAENAEVVQWNILRMRDWTGLGLSGLGFVVAVIGGWGEGFTD